MSKIFIKYKFPTYELDHGKAYELSAGFYKPEWMSVPNTFWELLGNDIDAQLLKIGQEEISEDVNVCPPSVGVKPRKFNIKFSDGRSMAIPFNPNSDNYLNLAKIVIDGLETYLPEGISIACVELQGEEVDNMLELVNYQFNDDSSVLSAGSGKYYSGYMSYGGDIVNPEIVPARVLSATGAIPAIFTNTWDTCVGAWASKYACGASSRAVKHRRLTFQYIGEGDLGRLPESRELPVANKSDLAACLENTLTASQGAIYCVGYKGESRKDFLAKIQALSANPAT